MCVWTSQLNRYTSKFKTEDLRHSYELTRVCIYVFSLSSKENVSVTEIIPMAIIKKRKESIVRCYLSQ